MNTQSDVSPFVFSIVVTSIVSRLNTLLESNNPVARMYTFDQHNIHALIASAVDDMLEVGFSYRNRLHHTEFVRTLMGSCEISEAVAYEIYFEVIDMLIGGIQLTYPRFQLESLKQYQRANYTFDILVLKKRQVFHHPS